MLVDAPANRRQEYASPACRERVRRAEEREWKKASPADVRRVWCKGCGSRITVVIRGGREVRSWCSPACRARVIRRQRVLMIADALEGDEAARPLALEAMDLEIKRARSEVALVAEIIALEEAEARQEANDE